MKVLDFGLSRLIDAPDLDAGDSGVLEGTPAFMSPEQILGRHVGPAADLYALGGVGYYLLTGSRPYAHLQGGGSPHRACEGART